MAITKIDSYRVIYSANRFAPRIGLKRGDSWLGQLIFMPNGTTLPQDREVNGLAFLYYHLDDFQNAIDLLRNESPMYLIFSGSGGGFENCISTTDEDVGEGESIAI